MLETLGHQALGIEAQDDEQHHRYHELSERGALYGRDAPYQRHDEARRLKEEDNQHGAEHGPHSVAETAGQQGELDVEREQGGEEIGRDVAGEMTIECAREP